MKDKKIIVFGLGYVGYSLSVMLSRYYKVIGIDIDQQKIDLVNNNKPTVYDTEISKWLKSYDLNLSAKKYSTSDLNSDFIIICLPTDYNDQLESFDTSIIEKLIYDLNENQYTGIIVIKSTVPIGFTNKLIKSYSDLKIIFSPEFLRENNGLNDNLNPSRLIIGGMISAGKEFKDLLLSCIQNNPKVLITKPSEAEAIKLFSNTYLAMRVAYFNEIDSFALNNDLDSKEIIIGTSLDERIGDYYNNPSFGYGGYCLPKDTKQTVSHINFESPLIKSIERSNNERKKAIAEYLLKLQVEVIGVYKISMKKNSNNIIQSSILDIIKILIEKNQKIIIYDDIEYDKDTHDLEIQNDFNNFIDSSDIIIANRKYKELEPVEKPIFSRDIFGIN